MALTNQTLALVVYERLKARGLPVTPSIVPRLVTLIPTALRLLPDRAKQLGEAEAEVYRADFLVTLTNGQGSFAASLNLSTGAMLPGEIVKVTHPTAITTTNAAGKLYRVGSEATLNLVRSLEFGYYAIEDNILYTSLNNDRTTLQGDATVRAAAIPAIGGVQVIHEPLITEIMTELAQGVMAQPQAA